RIPTTVLHLDHEPAGEASSAKAERSSAALRAGVAAGDQAAVAAAGRGGVTTRSGALAESQEASAAPAPQGYGLLIIGREPTAAGATFDTQITRSAARFGGPFAIAAARGIHRRESDAALNILVPVSGTRVSRQGAELAIALAQASRGSVTAL